MKPVLVACTFMAVTLATAMKNVGVERIVEWQQLQFGFPSESDRQEAVLSGNLEPANAVPIDVIPYYTKSGKLRLLTTIPKFTSGIPYSLATVMPQAGPHGPLLQPYPSYSWHNSGSNCDAITSAFRVAFTECHQMWVIDSGRANGEQLCPPQLLLFDLDTDQLLHRYRFNTSVYTPNASLLITPVVVVRDPPPHGQCREAMLYVADVTFHGLVVYDFARNAAWRAENRFMYPDPTYGVHTIAGTSFILMDGIFGLAASKQDNRLYFHPLASTSEFSVPLSMLDNGTIWEENHEAVPEEFRLLGERPSQCAATALDSSGNLFCVTMNPIRLLQWNIHSPYGGRHLRELSANKKLLEFVSGMKVVRNPQGREELWMLSNRFQRIATGTLDPDEVNFRIVRRPLDDVTWTAPGLHQLGALHTPFVFN